MASNRMRLKGSYENLNSIAGRVGENERQRRELELLRSQAPLLPRTTGELGDDDDDRDVSFAFRNGVQTFYLLHSIS